MLNFIQRICFLSSRFTWKTCVINFNLLGKLVNAKSFTTDSEKVFVKSFWMRLISYSILYYILHFSVHKIFFTFMTSESLSVSYIIAIAARWTKSVKFTLSIAVHTGVLAKNHFWLVATRKKRIGEQLKGKSRGPLLVRAALNAAFLGYNW